MYACRFDAIHCKINTTTMIYSKSNTVMYIDYVHCVVILIHTVISVKCISDFHLRDVFYSLSIHTAKFVIMGCECM